MNDIPWLARNDFSAIENQLQALFSIFWKFCIAADERNLLSDRLRNDEAVTWVVVIFDLFEFNKGTQVFFGNILNFEA